MAQSAKTNKRGERVLTRMTEELLATAKRYGYVVQFEVGRPAPHRQAVSMGSLYLKPLDGSDQFICSCCGNPYEFRLKSRHMPNYVPLNWCKGCRQNLVEAGGDVDRVLAACEASRRGTRDLARMSRRRIQGMIRAWGPSYARELERVCKAFDAAYEAKKGGGDGQATHD